MLSPLKKTYHYLPLQGLNLLYYHISNNSTSLSVLYQYSILTHLLNFKVLPEQHLDLILQAARSGVVV